MTVYREIAAHGDAIPVVVSIPHTGTGMPEAVAARFATAAMRDLPMTDWHLHRLYDFLPELGITTLHASVSRLVIDLNRAPDASPLYPGRFETGLVPTETFNGERIFSAPPGPDVIESLRQRYHEPYHDRLSELLRDRIDRFGRVILVDAHSIASGANRVHGVLADDIYLGDRDGTSCDPWLTDCVAAVFSAAGLLVRQNEPYKGGFITSHYGQRPEVDALQIEMCQRLYMDEDNPQVFREELCERMKKVLVTVFAGLAQQLELN